MGKIPWRRKWQPTPVLLPGKSHGWRTLAGYSPWGCKESAMTEQLHFLLSGSVQLLSCVRLFATPRTAARQASLSLTVSQSLLKLMSIESVIPSHPLSCPSPPALHLSQHQGLFPVSWLFASGGQSIGASASASVLPMNIQDIGDILHKIFVKYFM